MSEKLLGFLNNSPTAFHAVDESAKILRAAGFSELYENKSWKLEKGGKHYLRRNNSSLFAFEIGLDFLEREGFRVVGTHADFPNFKLKPGDAVLTQDGYVKLNTECYGGVILSTWFDRPLSLAGRVITKNENKCVERLVNIEKPILLIPSLCIHFNREVNEGHTLNKQTDMLPLLGFAIDKLQKSDYVLHILKTHAGISEEILDYDLFLYEADKGRMMGLHDEFISASRLDNLWMVFAGLQAIIKPDRSASTKVFVAFDNEEVGSTTRMGANSMFLNNTLQRICVALGLTFEQTQMALSNSLAVSADCAHAVHPNYSDKSDQTNRPVLGKGLAIKYSAAQKYGTNAHTAAIFIDMCNNNHIPYQKFVNRSDIAGGSTIGPSMSSMASIPTVDVGIPILAMHSVREFGCIADNKTTIEALSGFYLC